MTEYFWIVNDLKYPRLSLLVQDLLPAQASEAFTERVSSACGDWGADSGKRKTV